MLFNINGHAIDVETKGKYIVIKTNKGTYKREAFTSEPAADELPESLFSAMCGIWEQEQHPDYADWLEYMSSVGDYAPDHRRREDYEKHLEELRAWQVVADGLTASDVLDYLSENYTL